MNRLIPVEKREDIPVPYRDTPIGHLLEYHNLGRPFEPCAQAELLVGMCMDNRKYLHIPDNFAFIIRAGGANLLFSEFKVSYAIAVGGVSVIALIAHTQCGMVNLSARKDLFVEGLVKRAGWERDLADKHFKEFAPLFEIGNEVDFILMQAKHLRSKYPRITIVPMLYRVEDNRLYLLKENAS
jgi:carbonic anhydrase